MQSKRHSSRCSGGFTLIEMMIVVVIIAIMAAIAYPSYRQHVIRTKRAAAKAAMMDLANREQQILLADRVYADTSALKNTYHYTLVSEVSENYGWAVSADNAASPPTFSITFSPTGAQQSDGNLTLDSQGNKTPADKWVR